MGKTTDDLADAFAELPAEVTRCSLGRILDDASDTARQRIQAALDADHIKNHWIHAQLRAAGRSVGKDSVADHRAGRCRCAKP